jgi:NitT/TauT family transport system substrate-binding protein
MFPDFYPAAEKALGDDYREFRSDAYIAWFVLSATPEMLNDRPNELAAFVRALIKAEEFIKTNPDGAMAALETATEGLLSMETIKAKFTEAEYEIGLGKGLLDILETQANWVVEQGMVEATPSRDLLKGFLATGPIEAVDSARINLQ